MNTQNKKPNIRFNQFKELWKVVKLDSISQKVKSKNINNSFENVLTNSAEFGIVPQRDFFDKDIANLKSLSGYYVVQPNDFVYNPRISNKAPVGPIKANFLNITGVISPLYYVFRTQNIDVFFLAKYFDSSYWHKFMKLNGDTGARSDRFAIKDSVFKEMPIPFPSLAEQSAISTFFRNLDDLLSSYKDNLANYQSLKATMLSKMFPKAGQSVPEIRLNGFEGEWETKILSEVTNITMGQSPKSENYTDNPNDYILVQGNADIKDKQVVPRLWTTEVTKMAEIGDIILTVRAPVGDIGKTDYNVVIGRGVAAIKGNDFIFYTLEKMKKTGFWNRFSTGSTFESISSNDIKEAIIQIPTLKEQQAIGSYFSNLDNLINSHQEKITQLETLKKKLLQDMFI